jgi:hypothetical protein
MKCKYCDRETKSKNANTQHELRCKNNPNRIIVKPSYGMLGKKGANQYTYGAEMSNETKEKIRAASEAQIWTDERRNNHRVAMQQAVLEHPESYNSSNRGRTKQVIVDGIKLQGQWEVDFYLWAKESGLDPQRPTTAFKYIWNGERWYHPDFYIPSKNLYVEVKGYETDRDRAKWEQFPHKLSIIKEREIKQIRNKSFKGL